MKIGIDAKWFFSGPVSGQVFIRNILPELLALRPEDEWHLFLNKKYKSSPFPITAPNVHLHYVWAGYNMPSNLFVLPRLAVKHKLDVVLFQTFAVKRSSYRSLVFIHDILFEEYPQFFTKTEKLYFKFVRKGCRSADRIITTTETVKKDLLRFHYTGNNSNIDIAPLGVSAVFKSFADHDPAILKKIKDKYQLPGSYILSTGRLNARKNIEAIAMAIPMLNDKTIPVVVVGEKEWKAPRLEKILKNKEIASRLKFIGSIPGDELPAIYAMASVFCFPSFAEGFGLPPIEAMASGIPVIASQTTSLPEVCGNAALYIDPTKTEQIAVAITELLENNTLRQQKIKLGIERGRQFTWQRTAQAIIKSIQTSIQQ
jgi:glycosyltransferase involved in cell wall biosynthesis